jgi:hypothetical protein
MCAATMIDTSTNQIIDYCILECQKQKVKGNTDTVQGNMEIEGAEKLPTFGKKIAK